MNKIIKFLAISFVFLQLFGCNKTNVVKKSKTDLVTLNTWQVNIASLNPGAGPIVIFKKNATTNLFDVSKMTLTFKKDGTITATNKNGNILTGNWKFNSDETAITLPDGLPFKEVKITKLTATNLDLSVANFEYPVLGQTIKGLLELNFIPKA